MQPQVITIVGAGITGLWQALTLARRGHRVCLLERSPQPFAHAASAYAGAMLAPYCEAEASEPIVQELGVHALALWRAAYPGLLTRGTLVVAQARDQAELARFSRMTTGFTTLARADIDALEPACGGRFASALHFPAEAHMEPVAAMTFLLEAARAELAGLRGVRGERLLLRSREVALTRPMRLLHPRHPIYVVPWGEGRYMVGATVIESDDAGPVTVRSALELLGSAYALHPALAEAEILDAGAGVRPAFADNLPRILVRGRTLYVNGLYRHGFLLAPVLAELVAEYLQSGAHDARLFSIEGGG